MARPTRNDKPKSNILQAVNRAFCVFCDKKTLAAGTKKAPEGAFFSIAAKISLSWHRYGCRNAW